MSFELLDQFYRDAIGTEPVRIPAPSDELPDLSLLAYDTHEQGRPWTIVTRGMSARAMPTPERSGCPRRVELITYVPSTTREFTWWLGWLAAFPFIDQTWLGFGHTIHSLERLFPDSPLQHFLVLPSLVASHRDMEDAVTVAGDPVGLWWVLPITETERAFKREHGVDDLLDAFQQARLPVVVDPTRNSVV